MTRGSNHVSRAFIIIAVISKSNVYRHDAAALG